VSEDREPAMVRERRWREILAAAAVFT